jgi:hypothetical protein
MGVERPEPKSTPQPATFAVFSAEFEGPSRALRLEILVHLANFSIDCLFGLR